MTQSGKNKKENMKDVKAEELGKRLVSLRETLRELRFKMEGAKSKNVKEAKTLRRAIARILTEVNSRKSFQ